MSVKYYRPQIHNGPIRRRTAPVERWRRSLVAAARGGGRAGRRPGALSGIVAAGMLVAAGFVFALHLHFGAQRVGREAVGLRSRLDQEVAEGRELELKQQRATSPREIERRLGPQRQLAAHRLDAPEVWRALAPPAKPKR
ncbi:MAG TPA: hypothetical protein VFC61_12180 [Blastocatellia bacterium]|nr:hypothetical protein [Blastocatellia bacterium]